MKSTVQDTMKWTSANFHEEFPSPPDGNEYFDIKVEFSSEKGLYLDLKIYCDANSEGKRILISIPVAYKDGFMHYGTRTENRYNAKELLGESLEYIHDFFSKVIGFDFNVEKATPSPETVPDEKGHFESETAKFFTFSCSTKITLNEIQNNDEIYDKLRSVKEGELKINI